MTRKGKTKHLFGSDFKKQDIISVSFSKCSYFLDSAELFHLYMQYMYGKICKEWISKKIVEIKNGKLELNSWK